MNEIFELLKINTFCQDVYDKSNKPFSSQQFFVLNELDGDGRGNRNVSCFKNFLIEIDKGTLTEQLAYLQKNLPFKPTLVTFSGGKSLHAIISLNKPLKDLEEYRKWSKALYGKLDQTFIDPSCSNPSRLTRTPGVQRDDGKTQTLIEFNDEIDKDIFWVFIRDKFPKPYRREQREPGKVFLSKKSWAFLRKGECSEFGGRNNAVFKVAFAILAQGGDPTPAFEKGAELGLTQYEIDRIKKNLEITACQIY